MDKIREAFESELAKGKLSEQRKREMIKASRKSTFRFVPVVTMLVAALSLFLMWSIWQTDSLEQDHFVSMEQTNVKDLEQAILTYTNELLEADAQDGFYLNVGESYPLRLALEQNSGLFYSDADLTKSEKMLLSKFLHYLQNVHVLQLNPEFQPVETMDELLQQAPLFIERWEGMDKPFKSIRDEQKNPKLADFEAMDWLVFFCVIIVGVLIIMKLWRSHYRVPPIIWGLILLLYIISSIINLGYVAYDETSMVKIIEEDLERSHVRIVGEPKVEAIAGNSLNRYMLLSYEDGLEVVGSFSEENGFFYWQGNTWGGKNRFLEHSTLQVGQFEDVQLLTYILPQSFEHTTVKMDVEGEIVSFDVPKDRASIWMYRHDGKDIDFYYE